MPKPGSCLLLAAVLALHTHASAQVPERKLPNEVQVRLQFGDGTDRDCKVLAWNGLGLEGSCGTVVWDRLKPANALAVLEQLAGRDDPAAGIDAATVALSLGLRGSSETRAIDWARRSGATGEAIEKIKADAAALAKERAVRVREREAARLVRLTPEAGAFPSQPLRSLHRDDVTPVSDASIEEARALLGRAGGGGILHRADRIALLVESGDRALVRDLVLLDRAYAEWIRRIGETGVAVSDQGIVPVVLAGDRDRWRLLVQAAFEGDAARFPDAVTIYPETGLPSAPRPIVLVNPSGDAVRVRYGAAVGLARAALHVSGTPTRPPAWLNEGLPRAMAADAVRIAAMDEEMRKRGLAAIRAGAGFGAVIDTGYGEGLWESDAELAQSLSYLLASWLLEKEPSRTMQYARGPRIAESEADRFARVMGITLREAQARAVRWYQVND